MHKGLAVKAKSLSGLLNHLNPDCELFLAVSILAFEGIFSEPLGQLMVETYALRLLVFDDTERKIKQWLP